MDKTIEPTKMTTFSTYSVGNKHIAQRRIEIMKKNK